MLFRTHLTFGAFIGVLLFVLYPDQINFLFLIGIALGSALPDLDTMGSWIGRRLRHFSRVISTIFGHRAILHSIAIPIIIYFFLEKNKFGAGLIFGYLGHLFLDALTKQGVKPLWPFGMKIQGPITTGSLWETVLLFLLAGLSISILMLRV